jgi:hypothetical protein
MANIMQAAKWMKAGKDVMLKSEPLEVFSSSEYFDGTIMESRCESISSFARLTTKQILANDWEIVK